MTQNATSSPICAVTGAGGFIGSHLTEALLEGGWRVRALVHYHALGGWGHLEEVLRAGEARQAEWWREGRLSITAGDVQDARCVRELVRGCDCVFHLAALIGIPYSYVAPQAYVNININGTLNVLEACRDGGAGRLIHTSTSEAYGTARVTPITEEHPLQAQSPYAATKIAADKLVESYGLSFGLKAVTARPFNAYGPRQSARAVIPTILTQALDPRCAQIRLGALDPVRDYTFAPDTAQAFLALATAPLEAVAGGVFNIAQGRGVSIGELATLALRIAGAEKPIVTDPARVRPGASEVRLLLGDRSRLEAATGWQPRVDLETGLTRTADWIRQHLDQYHVGAYTL